MVILQGKCLVLLVTLFLVFGNGYGSDQIQIADYSNKEINDESLLGLNFAENENLEEVNLSNNNIKHIPKDIFAENKALTKVNLSGNKALVLPEDDELLESGSVVELNLSGCNIKSIPESAFASLPALKILDLSDNPIDLNDNAFIAAMDTIVEKLIVSEIEEDTKRELCKDYDLTIEIKNEGLTQHCEDVRNEINDTEQKTEEEVEIQPALSEEKNDNAAPTELPKLLSDNETEHVENNQDVQVPLIELTADKKVDAEVLKITHEHYEEVVDSGKMVMENTNDLSIEASGQPILLVDSVNVTDEEQQPQGIGEIINNNESQEISTLPPGEVEEIDVNHLNNGDISVTLDDNVNKPTDVPVILETQINNDEVNLEPREPSNTTEDQVILKARLLPKVDVEVAPEEVINNANDGLNNSNKEISVIADVKDDDKDGDKTRVGEIKSDETTESASRAWSNIIYVVGGIGAVLVATLGYIAYRRKNSKYSTVNKEEQGREMTEIRVISNEKSSSCSLNNKPESKPLMHQSENVNSNNLPKETIGTKPLMYGDADIRDIDDETSVKEDFQSTEDTRKATT